mmetsp:Transcript_10969/g.19848  ORF Transcript_10969/g.19848 Transcript_10969/m.19848 type:complete len:234 (+) Transcript_10969:268-969(+)
MTIHVPHHLRPTQEGLLQGDLGVHVEVVSPTLELCVLGSLEREHDAARNLARPLLRHAREGQRLPISHALLQLHFYESVLDLALLLALNLLLLLHEHARSHLAVHEPNLVGTAIAALTLRRVWLHAAAAAHYPSLYPGLVDAAVVEVLQRNGQVHADVIALLNLFLLCLFHSLHSSSVVEDLLVRIVQNLIGISNLCELDLGRFVRVLVWVVLDGEFPIDLLDLTLVRIILEP